VLIFKASGVFNFGPGRHGMMAALALVRALDLFERGTGRSALRCSPAFASPPPSWRSSPESPSGLVLRKLVNQEAQSLFMATIGVTFFIEGSRRPCSAADVYPLNIGLPKEPLFILESLFDGRHLVNELDIWARHRRPAGGRPGAVLPADPHRPRRCGRRRRPCRGPVGRHPVKPDLVHRLGWVAGLVALVAGAVWGASSACSSRSRCWR